MFLQEHLRPPVPSIPTEYICSRLPCTDPICLNVLHDFPRWILDGWGLYEVTRNINVGKFIVGLIVGKSHRISSDVFIRFAQ